MKKILYILIFFLPIVLKSQTYTENEIKAAYIYNFISNIEWPNTKNLKEFKIALIGEDNNLKQSLELLSETKKVQNLPIKILQSSNINRILFDKPQVIYLLPNNTYDIKDVYYAIVTQPILLISDDEAKKAYIMINFTYTNDNKISFELYTDNIKNQGLKILPKLLLLGGTQVDIKKIYKEKEEELLKEKKIVLKQKLKLNEQKQKIKEQLNAIDSQNKLIEEKKSKISSLMKKLKQEEILLSKNQSIINKQKESITNQQQILKKKSLLLSKQEDSILKQKQTINRQKIEISSKLRWLDSINIQISHKQKLISEQKKQLNNLELKLNQQKTVIFLLLSILFLILLFIFFWIRNYKQKKLLSDKLKIQNREIEAQAQELMQLNSELEKLSIVAKETSNGVVIADSEGLILWINQSFSIFLYKINYNDELIGQHISNVFTDKRISELLSKIKYEKKSFSFETFFIDRDNNPFWLQISLSPTINYAKNIDKIVIVTADITQIKLAEKEIERKNEELEVQKNKILEQNELINQSLLYAKKLQEALLPNLDNFYNIFSYFLIYLPKDIISGDFYWTEKVQSKTKEYYFVIVADCTGHGVPGALLSIVGSRLMSEIIFNQKNYNPQKILTLLNERFLSVLKQEKKDSLDGMDLALVRIERKGEEYEIIFAGAKRPLLYYDFDKKILQKFNGVRKSIGGILQNTNLKFTQNDFVAKSGDILYLYTDGYIDQGNSQRRRFGTRRLLEILERNAQLSLDEQKIILMKSLTQWQSTEMQRDDITFLGIKLK